MGSSSSKSKPIVNELVKTVKKDLKYPINNNINSNIKLDGQNAKNEIKSSNEINNVSENKSNTNNNKSSVSSLNYQLNSSLHLELSKSQPIVKPKKSKNLLDDAINSNDTTLTSKDNSTKLYTSSEFNSKLRDLQSSSHRKYEETVDFTNSELKEPLVQDEADRDILDSKHVDTINQILKNLANKNTKLAQESRLIFSNNNDQRSDVTQVSRKNKHINLEDNRKDNYADMVSVIDTSTVIPTFTENNKAGDINSTEQIPNFGLDERNSSLIANIHKISSNIVNNNATQNIKSDNRPLPKDRSPSSNGLSFDTVPKGKLDHYALLELFISITKAPEIPLADVASHYNISENDIKLLTKYLKLPYLIMQDDRLTASTTKVPGV